MVISRADRIVDLCGIRFRDGTYLVSIRTYSFQTTDTEMCL